MVECKDCYLSEEEKIIKRIAKRRYEELQALPAIILKKSLKDIEDELMAEYMHRNVHRESSTIDNPPKFPIH